jgi:antirestriction protein ArdC
MTAPDARRAQSTGIATWLQVLSNDERVIVFAGIHVLRAADCLYGLQPHDGNPE